MICIAADGGGAGGVGGGAGSSGQASQDATGAAAHGYGYPCIEVVTGMTVTLQVKLTNDTGGAVPTNLSGMTSVKFVARPSMSSCDREISVNCTVVTPTEGLVSLTLTPAELDYNNGVWYAEFHVYNGTALVKNYRAYLVIRKGMTGSGNSANTVTVMDVRLAVMDTDPAANQLLDDLEFSDVMILNAVERCINEWNETPPELACKFDMTTFPYKEHLIKGAVGYLMQMVAYKYTRNRMQYQASGFALDNNDKGPQYINLATMARQEWKMFIMSKKTEHNMSECFGTVDMPYFGGHGYWE